MTSSCSICDSVGSKIVELKDGYDAYRCVGCSVVYADPMPSPEELNTFYSKWMFSKPADNQVRTWEQYSTLGITKIMAQIVVSRAEPIRKALDFGGGLGFFANALSKHVADVTLFDMSGPSRDYARASFPAIRVCDEADAALACGPFDLILLNQVIEHVPDPVSFARPLVDALAPGGLLIVTTPNNQMADPIFRLDLLRRYSGNAKGSRAASMAKVMTDSWLCLDPPRHVYAFTAEGLKRAIERAGGRTIRTFTKTYLDDPFGYPAYTGTKRFPRLKHVFRSTGQAIVNVFDRRSRHGQTLIGYFERAAQ
jgi:2-polyprenyl-3-methyl-5-hydroxy-6-metoxy-1,4-benzoquinol methylase